MPYNGGSSSTAGKPVALTGLVSKPPPARAGDTGPRYVKKPKEDQKTSSQSKTGPNRCQAFISWLWSILATIVSFFKTYATQIWSSLKGITAKIPALALSMKNSFIDVAQRGQYFVLSTLIVSLFLFFFWDFNLAWTSLGYLLTVCFFGVRYRLSKNALQSLINQLFEEEEDMQEQHNEKRKKVREFLIKMIKKMNNAVGDLDFKKRSRLGQISYVFAKCTGWWSDKLATIQEIVNTAEDVENQKRTDWLKKLMDTLVSFADEHPEICKNADYQNGCTAVINAANTYEKVLIECKKMMEEFHKMTDKERIKALNHVKSTWSDFLNVITFGFFKRY